MIPSVASSRVTHGQEVPCITTEPANESRFLLKRMTAYTPSGDLLVQDLGEMEGSDHWGNHYSRTSGDHGRTWSSASPLAPAYRNDSGKWVRMGESTFLEGPDFLYRIYNLHEYPESGFRSDIWWYNNLMIQEWNESVGDFTAPDPLDWDIPEAERASFWTYGRNALAVSFSRPIVIGGGRIILPVQWIPELPEYKHPVLRWRAGCLIGRRSGRRLKWKPGGFIDLSVNQSSRGVFEPAIAEMLDGRMLMIARASNTGAPHLPSHKWMSASEDGGETWNTAVPLTWSDGAPVISPSSGCALIRNASGSLYWLGNISSDPVQGNRPRYPLALVRVQEGSEPSLDPASIHAIDCRLPDESEFLQLSNFKIHMDRKSKEFVIAYARLESQGAGLRGASSTERRILV